MVARRKCFARWVSEHEAKFSLGGLLAVHDQGCPCRFVCQFRNQESPFGGFKHQTETDGVFAALGFQLDHLVVFAYGGKGFIRDDFRANLGSRIGRE